MYFVTEYAQSEPQPSREDHHMQHQPTRISLTPRDQQQGEDEGMTEAMRRLEEDEDNPAAWLSHDEFLAAVRSGPAE